MLAASYNNNGLNDVLIVMLKNSSVEDQTFERRENVTKITNKETGETVGFNFFDASSLLNFENNGPTILSNEQILKLNEIIKSVNFEDMLEVDTDPKFVIGFVKECQPLEDSDHLNVTKTEVDHGEVLQIVCGAKNIAQGQKVVVAKEGAIMPNGMVIWSGELRGVKSKGMICSASELGIKDSKQQQGILVLNESEKTGEPFKQTVI